MQLQELKKWVDVIAYIELRFDLWLEPYIDYIQQVKNVIDERNSCIKIIATIRTLTEGGMFQETDSIYEDKLNFFSHQAEIDIIDLEYRPKSLDIKKLEFLIRTSGKKVILSKHDFLRTWDAEEIKFFFKQTQKFSYDFLKLAFMVQKPADALLILQMSLYFQQYYNRQFIFIGMGELGKITRLFADTFGSKFTFAALNAAGSAPGQYQIEELLVLRNNYEGV